VHRHGEHDAAVGRYVHLEIDGVDHRVFYEEAGSGIPLLCQHTAGADARQWRHLLEDERVTSRFRVIAYDLPYHGRSVPPDSVAWWAQPYRLTTAFAMEVPNLLAEVLGLDRPVFVGSSIGGMLALDLARYHPDRYRASISVEGALKVPASDPALLPEGLAASIGATDPTSHAELMMMVMSATAPEARRHETWLHYAQGAPGVFPGDLFFYQVDHDLTGEAEHFDTARCPVFMLTGVYDFPTIEGSRDAAARIPGVELDLMEGLGHFPMSEDPVRFAEHLLPVLDRIAGGAGAAA
jgi:pimeloyl-ACP methyl ester carboxylesterase